MFRKILLTLMFATACGYCFAAENGMPQVVTSQVFYTNDNAREEQQIVQTREDYREAYVAPAEIPVWPLAGSDADTTVSCSGTANCKKSGNDNIRIVSKIGADLVVENNFNLGARGSEGTWSGGANMLHGAQLPAGFGDECGYGSEMPLLSREMLEDDGGTVLAVSRSNRKCIKGKLAGLSQIINSNGKSGSATINGVAIDGGDLNSAALDGVVIDGVPMNEIAVDESADAEAPKNLQDQVRSWVVASGQTLREVLQKWCDKEGWDLVWGTAREYPIEASAVFKGRFVDVSSALVRNFGRATPIPYAKFYKGNRVLVVSTNEE
jgi:hypothetical protein